jgi:hypothetical protein
LKLLYIYIPPPQVQQSRKEQSKFTTDFESYGQYGDTKKLNNITEFLPKLFQLIRCPDMQISGQKYLKSFTVLLNNFIVVMGTKRKRNNAVEVINNNRAKTVQLNKVSFFEN